MLIRLVPFLAGVEAIMLLSWMRMAIAERSDGLPPSPLRRVQQKAALGGLLALALFAAVAGIQWMAAG